MYWLPLGIHDLTWRGDTLVNPWDFVFIYIPKGAFLKLSKLSAVAKYVKDSEKFAENAKRASDAGQLGLDLLFGSVLQSYPDGVFNEETQQVAITDNTPPVLSTSRPGIVPVEAVKPGGVDRETALYNLQRTLSATDNCDPKPMISANNHYSLPSFIPVGSTATVDWVASDHGPKNLSGGVNTSAVLHQTFIVTDTLAPILQAPPDIVTETASTPAVINLGNPATFNLADLNPIVTNNACSRPNVTCDLDGTRHFPAGQTTVTWKATDHSGNASTAQQLVNVKAVGSNHAPTANSLTGANAPQAISFEPITITLTAHDADSDPMWFKIKDEPQHGFFHSPLYPYFIQDYRLANFSNISFLDWCAVPSHRQAYIPTNWPVNADFMAVDDAGTVYVHDEGMIWCDSFGDVSTNYRLAIFHPDGTWTQVASSFDVKGVYIDWRNHFIYATSTDVGGSFENLYKYDLNLNPILTYDLDQSNAPFFSTGPRQGFMDSQLIIYATDGFQYAGAAHLFLLDGRTPNQPDLLADYSLSGATWQDLALDSQGNLYASERNNSRVYKFSPAKLDAAGHFTAGALIGWLGKCDSGPGCDQANHRSFGFSCTDATCSLAGSSSASGSGAGQFDFPRGIALDPNDILYVTDYNNLRVQRFTAEGYFAGQAISKCDGSCFVLGDFGRPKQVTVNSSHFYVLDDSADLLHVFETTPLTRVNDHTAQIVYQSQNNFVNTDHFTYVATDGLANSAPASVDVKVSRNYRPPSVNPVAPITTTEDVTVPLGLSGYDPDGALDTLTFQAGQPPAHGTLVKAGNNLKYAPAKDFNGIDVFTVVANDGKLLSQPRSVSVTVTPVNDPPSFPDTASSPSGFAYHLSGDALDLARFAQLGTSSAPLQIGRGFETIFNVTFYDPDAQDTHTVDINWGDGSPNEPEGKLLPDGTTTGPIVSEGKAGGTGSVTAKHVFSTAGDFSPNFCVTDNVSVDSGGNKHHTSASTTTCKTVPVHVSAKADILLNVTPSSNPVPAGRPLSITVVFSNSLPASGPGVTATGLVITDTLDARAQFQSVHITGGSCSHAGSVITCHPGALAPGQATSIQIGIGLASGLLPGDNLSNLVEYHLNEPDQADVQAKFDLFTAVPAADFIVNTIADEGDSNTGDGVCADADGACSLRAAVEQANATAGAQTIALPDWQIILNSNLSIDHDLTITGLGAGKTVLAGNGSHGILDVASGATVTLSDLTLQAGYEASADGGGLHVASGGGVTLNRVQLSGNHAGGQGGAIWNGGSLTLNDSAITGNDAGGGAGGIANIGTLNLNNVTISGNHGQSGGGLSSSGSATLVNVTVANNHATVSGGGLSGGPANLALQNTILADNTADGSGPNCATGFNSLGHNLVDNLAGCTAAGQTGTNVVGKDARLASLDFNGADTLMHALLGGSPAIDAGACALATDQRGQSRPVDGNLDGSAGCDIGAFEFTPVKLYLPILRH